MDCELPIVFLRVLQVFSGPNVSQKQNLCRLRVDGGRNQHLSGFINVYNDINSLSMCLNMFIVLSSREIRHMIGLLFLGEQKTFFLV